MRCVETLTGVGVQKENTDQYILFLSQFCAHAVIYVLILLITLENSCCPLWLLHALGGGKPRGITKGDNINENLTPKIKDTHFIK